MIIISYKKGKKAPIFRHCTAFLNVTILKRPWVTLGRVIVFKIIGALLISLSEKVGSRFSLYVESSMNKLSSLFTLGLLKWRPFERVRGQTFGK